MEQELHGDIQNSVGIAPVAIATDTSTVSAIIDTKGFESFEWIVTSGVITDGAYAFTIEDGEDSGLSDAAAVDSTLIIGTALSFAAPEDGVSKKLGIISKKRYQRLTIVSTGTTSGGLFDVLAVLGHAHSRPVS